jgi:hypothetical protein
MSGALLIAKMKVVELRRALCSFQSICDQRGLTACQNCGHALSAHSSWCIFRKAARVRDWYCERSSHISLLSYID